jgi:hypothetical protein
MNNICRKMMCRGTIDTGFSVYAHYVSEISWYVSVVCTMTRLCWTYDEFVVELLAGVRDLSLLHIVQTGPEPPHPTFSGVWGALSLGIKQLSNEADYSSHSMLRLRMSGAVPPLPICLHDVNRVNFFSDTEEEPG